MSYDRQLFTNNAVALLQAPITATSTSLTVMAGYGDLYPNPQTGEFFLITLEDQSITKREIIRVDSRVGDVLYFDISHRGQEGTTAQAWSASSGDDTMVDHRVTAATMQWAMELPIPGSVTPPGAEVVDADFDFSTTTTTTVITLRSSYAANSTKVHVAGLRLKRNVDFIESADAEITLLFPISQANIDDGSSIVIDYVVA